MSFGSVKINLNKVNGLEVKNMARLGILLVVAFIVIGLVPIGINNLVIIQEMKRHLELSKEMALEDGIKIVKVKVRDWAKGEETKEEIAKEIAGEKTSENKRNTSLSLFKEGSYGFLWDTKGNAIIHPLYEGMNYKDVPELEYRKVLEQMLQIGEGCLETIAKNPITGKKVRYGFIFRYYTPLNLIIGYQKNLSGFRLPLEGMIRITWIWLIVAGVAVGVASIIFSIVISMLQKRLNKQEQERTQAIRSFGEILEQIMKGNLSARIDTKGWTEELAAIGESINALIVHLEYEKERKD
jgi:methyl-accepting chemotaxis protein